MELDELLTLLLIGAIAGFLGSQVVKGKGKGFARNTVVGILGALIFGHLFGRLEIFDQPLLNRITGGTIGAIGLLVVIGLVNRQR